MKTQHLKKWRLFAAVLPMTAALAFSTGGAAQADTTGSLSVTDSTAALPGVNPLRPPEAADLAAGDPQNFWDGGSFRINGYGESSAGGLHRSVAATVPAVASPCSDAQVTIHASAVFENLGPDSGWWWTGGLSVMDSDFNDYPGATGTSIDSRVPPGAGVGDHDVDISVTVPLSELVAGNVVIVGTIETGHDGLVKDWLLKDFSATYSLACPPVVVDDTPTGVVGEDLTFDPLANDTAESGTTGSPASFDVSTLELEDPNHPGSWTTGPLTIPGEGTYTVNTSTGEVTFEPVDGFTGEATKVPYRVENTDGLPGEGSITVTLEPADPSLALVKSSELTSDANGDGFADVGDEITYSFTVTNDGNVTIEDVAIDDPRVSGVSPASANIDAGDQRVFTSDPYVVTQDDIDAGGVFNSAVAEGSYDDDGDPDTDPQLVSSPRDYHQASTPERAPGLTVVKDAELGDTNGNGKADWGEQIVYSFTVTNSGNVTVGNVAVDDPMLDERGLSVSPDPAGVVLLPGDVVVFSADPYVVTRDDTTFGQLSNTATASGWTTYQLEVMSDPDTVVVDTNRPTAALPDTGGASVWVPVAIIAMLAAGTLLLTRRQTT